MYLGTLSIWSAFPTSKVRNDWVDFRSNTSSGSLVSLATHGESGLELALTSFHIYLTFICQDLQWQAYGSLLRSPRFEI